MAYLAGYRPSRRFLGILLVIPLISVSAVAWLSANVFNGTVFALAAIVLTRVAARLGTSEAEPATPRLVAIGVVLFVFGWVYPHLVNPGSLLIYLYAAPTGLIPCPTLSTVLGLSLVFRGLGSFAWSAVAGALSLLFGMYGALILGVGLDWVLAIGALFALAPFVGGGSPCGESKAKRHAAE